MTITSDIHIYHTDIKDTITVEYITYTEISTFDKTKYSILVKIDVNFKRQITFHIHIQ